MAEPAYKNLSMEEASGLRSQGDSGPASPSGPVSAGLERPGVLHMEYGWGESFRVGRSPSSHREADKTETVGARQ